MGPARGDVVVELVPDAPVQERVRVSRFLIALDFDRCFPDEATAVRHALVLARASRSRVYLRTPRGWTDLRPN